MQPNIQKLSLDNPEQAEKAWKLFQKSYRMEADLIETDDFPPLRRTIQEMQSSSTRFYGFIIDGGLAGVIELNSVSQELDICSLVVDPYHFRKGIASQLLEFAIETYQPSTCVVETATKNLPAIRLYQSKGFVEEEIWMTNFDIEKIKLRRASK
ncbi:MAG: GNAT family N-acetyltransferase [Reichenbachiella sp.]|uniref:GNAT family N-acetyltransferase n=1 Tax=Reichenbachiella sp. TaxID=2184521 RepID=UPI003263C057